MQQGKPFLWHFSQQGEAVLYSLTAKKIFLPLKPWKNRWNSIANLNLWLQYEAQRDTTQDFSKSSCRQSLFGIFCQLTPPSISLNSLPSVILYKPKFCVVAGCLTSIFHLSFIQLLSTSTFIPCHQHTGITCPKWNKSGVARGWAQRVCAWHQAGQVPRGFSLHTSAHTGVQIPFPLIAAQLNLS